VTRIFGLERLRVSVAVTAFALVLAGVLLAPGSMAQTPTLEDLAAHDEILRARLEALIDDLLLFKAQVAVSTAALKADMASGDTAVRTEVTAVSEVAVPVGGIIAWSGNLSSIPKNFELCDGNEPTTAGAAYTGNKPDLRARFIRGASLAVGTTGGQDTIEDATTWSHVLTITEMPSHTHPWNYGWEYDDDGGGGSFREFTHRPGPYTPPYLGNPSSPVLSEGGDQPHSHGISGHDNRPEYYELFYIIRVK